MEVNTGLPLICIGMNWHKIILQGTSDVKTCLPQTALNLSQNPVK